MAYVEEVNCNVVDWIVVELAVGVERGQAYGVCEGRRAEKLGDLLGRGLAGGVVDWLRVCVLGGLRVVVQQGQGGRRRGRCGQRAQQSDWVRQNEREQ